jgi:hypothetical protein
VTASADPDTVSVAFYRDGSTLIGSDTSSAGGWSIAWNTVGVPNGAHTLTAVATDTAGNVGPASAPVAVTIDNPLIVEVRVGSSSDDAEQKPNTNVTLASTDLDMMNDGATTLTGVGLRFTGIAVPQGATIAEAYIQFTTDEVVSTTTTLTIHGQAADNAGTFTTAKNNILGRTRTGVSVGWQVDPWVSLNSAGPAERTPDLSAIVQEIVDRTGWSQGNAIAFVVTGVGRRVARAFDHTPALAPKLHIEYEL